MTSQLVLGRYKPAGTYTSSINRKLEISQRHI